MKHLISIAVGAAIAGALVTLLMKRRAGSVAETFEDAIDGGPRDVVGRGTGTGFTVEELIADTPAGRTLNS